MCVCVLCCAVLIKYLDIIYMFTLFFQRKNLVPLNIDSKFFFNINSIESCSRKLSYEKIIFLFFRIRTVEP